MRSLLRLRLGQPAICLQSGNIQKHQTSLDRPKPSRLTFLIRASSFFIRSRCSSNAATRCSGLTLFALLASRSRRDQR